MGKGWTEPEKMEHQKIENQNVKMVNQKMEYGRRKE